MNIILCGMPGSGKTHYGCLAAKHLKCSFIDTDQLLENKHQMTCREVVLMKGEAYFRSEERKVILGLEGTKNTIIALGGGALLTKENIPFLQQLGCLIYLKTSSVKKALPPFLQGKTFEEVLKGRNYEEVSHRFIDIEEENVLAIICEIYGQ